MTKPITLSFLGAGNMATALIAGLLKQGFTTTQICAYDINESALARLKEKYSVITTSRLRQAVDTADCIILAVKPQVMKNLCQQLEPKSDSLVLSIAAGIRSDDISRWLNNHQSIVRCMPNTPALVGLGASGLFAREAVTEKQKDLAQQIVDCVGISLWVKQESLIDTITAVSGSGPAYFFAFMEAMQAAAIQLGLSAEDAQILVKQTSLGAATMAQHEDISLLRQNVTSKGGTTEKALDFFNQQQFNQIVSGAMTAAKNRAETLAREFGQHETD